MARTACATPAEGTDGDETAASNNDAFMATLYRRRTAVAEPWRAALLPVRGKHRGVTRRSVGGAARGIGQMSGRRPRGS
jgi:hypothetical protein